MKKITFIVGILFILASCTNDIRKSKIITGPVSFQNDIIPIFNQQCNISGCHDGVTNPPQTDLTPANAYTDLFAKNQIDTLNPSQSNLYIRMTTTVPLPMPPGGLLPASQTNLILNWITEGAKNN
jgi:hypothetical protein